MVSPPNSMPKNVRFEWAPNYWPAGGAHASRAGHVDMGGPYIRDAILTFRRDLSFKLKVIGTISPSLTSNEYE